ncbi:hypothetical protein [Ferrimonas aestuarii]|uniref:Uncharacterized protein n=1 Tax=Ferrimonas aestuarii TaxID=2569539 RepID=A0A4U1BNA0_9GAMM|nr:hypothetical protein [Ferrimonas aestuarii]TKB53076.1 hypothetical protein FCL42_15495 [Ferrimonas aestuarii]
MAIAVLSQEFKLLTDSQKLDAMGISPSAVEQAMWKASREYRSASELEPLNAGGSRASFEAVRTLREALLSMANGWKILNKHGQCLTINPERGLSILVTSGDKDTGLVDGQPKTKNGKGAETKLQVSANRQMSFDLFGEPANQSEEECIDKQQTWVLLYYFDFVKKEVRFELSLPVAFQDSGKQGKVKISDWKDRIYFKPIPLDDAARVNSPSEFNEEPDIEVVPKDDF